MDYTGRQKGQNLGRGHRYCAALPRQLPKVPYQPQLTEREVRQILRYRLEKLDEIFSLRKLAIQYP